jgi:micrococcal nuclease
MRRVGSAHQARRLALLAITIALSLSGLAVPALAFPDVPADHPHAGAIRQLADLGIVHGKKDGSFAPSEPVKRAQFAKMLIGALSVSVDEEDEPAPFTDLGPDDPFDLYPHEYVAAAYYFGIVRGQTPTTFAPWAGIRRAQVVTMVVRALDLLYPALLDEPPFSYKGTWGIFDAVHGRNAAKAEWNDLLWGLGRAGPTGRGELSGLDPWGQMPRGEVAQVLQNMLPLVSFPLDEAEVLRVLPGGTLEVLYAGEVQLLRLIGIALPEPRHPFHEEAQSELERMLVGSEVGLQFDVERRDDAGRWLAYVWYWDYDGPALANIDLVLLGLGVSLPVAPNLLYQEALREAEDFARETGRGMWGG